MLMCVPSLYNDLQTVFQFQNFQRVPELIQCDSDGQLTSLDAKDKTSDEVDDSEYDSDEDLQSGEGDCVSSILIWKSIKHKSEARSRLRGFSVVVSVR